MDRRRIPRRPPVASAVLLGSSGPSAGVGLLPVAILRLPRCGPNRPVAGGRVSRGVADLCEGRLRPLCRFTFPLFSKRLELGLGSRHSQLCCHCRLSDGVVRDSCKQVLALGRHRPISASVGRCSFGFHQCGFDQPWVSSTRVRPISNNLGRFRLHHPFTAATIPSDSAKLPTCALNVCVVDAWAVFFTGQRVRAKLRPASCLTNPSIGAVPNRDVPATLVSDSDILVQLGTKDTNLRLIQHWPIAKPTEFDLDVILFDAVNDPNKAS